MEIAFLGYDDSNKSEHKRGFQYFPIYERGMSLGATADSTLVTADTTAVTADDMGGESWRLYPGNEEEMNIGQFSSLGRDCSHWMHFDTVDFSSNFYIETYRGVGTTRLLLHKISYTASTDEITVNIDVPYIELIETIRVGENELYIIVNYVKPTFSNFSEDLFYIKSDTYLALKSVALYLSGIFANYVQPYGARAQKLVDECLPGHTPDLSGPFTYPAARVICIPWTVWGQENITFQSLMDCFPDRTFGCQPWHNWGQENLSFNDLTDCFGDSAWPCKVWTGWGQDNASYRDLQDCSGMYGPHYWTHWGQQSITFDYMVTNYQGLSLENLG